MAAHNPTSSSLTDNHSSSNGYSLQSDGRLGFLNSEKNMLLESHPHPVSGGQQAAGNTDGILHVAIHHACDIHNICIYGNQDVYAKFSIAHCEDAVYSTQPVKAGGKNPIFNQSLQIPVSRPDAVLKCEIWMMSCARNYLEDQLLGFVLVPLGSLYGKAKRTQDYCLTSTDLFYTPAGTVCLSLLFHSRSMALFEHELDGKMLQDSNLSPSSPVGMMDWGHRTLAPADLSKIEFPDLQAASENERFVKMYLKMAAGDVKGTPGSNGATVSRGYQGKLEDGAALGAPFLQLGASPVGDVDYEMSSSEVEVPLVLRSSSLFSHTSPTSNASLSHAEASIPARDMMGSSATELISGAGEAPNCNSPNEMISTDSVKGTQPATSSSSIECFGPSSSEGSDNQDKGKAFSTGQNTEGSSFSASVVNIVEAEVPVSQQQIIEMYMKSMQQSTERLANMKLPTDMEAQECTVSRKMRMDKNDAEENKEGHKLFYGSRAFF